MLDSSNISSQLYMSQETVSNEAVLFVDTVRDHKVSRPPSSPLRPEAWGENAFDYKRSVRDTGNLFWAPLKCSQSYEFENVYLTHQLVDTTMYLYNHTYLVDLVTEASSLLYLISRSYHWIDPKKAIVALFSNENYPLRHLERLLMLWEDTGATLATILATKFLRLGERVPDSVRCTAQNLTPVQCFIAMQHCNNQEFIRINRWFYGLGQFLADMNQQALVIKWYDNPNKTLLELIQEIAPVVSKAISLSGGVAVNFTALNKICPSFDVMIDCVHGLPPGVQCGICEPHKVLTHKSDLSREIESTDLVYDPVDPLWPTHQLLNIQGNRIADVGQELLEEMIMPAPMEDPQQEEEHDMEVGAAIVSLHLTSVHLTQNYRIIKPAVAIAKRALKSVETTYEQVGIKHRLERIPDWRAKLGTGLRWTWDPSWSVPHYDPAPAGLLRKFKLEEYHSTMRGLIAALTCVDQLDGYTFATWASRQRNRYLHTPGQMFTMFLSATRERRTKSDVTKLVSKVLYEARLRGAGLTKADENLICNLPAILFGGVIKGVARGEVSDLLQDKPQFGSDDEDDDSSAINGYFTDQSFGISGAEDETPMARDMAQLMDVVKTSLEESLKNLGVDWHHTAGLALASGTLACGIFNLIMEYLSPTRSVSVIISNCLIVACAIAQIAVVISGFWDGGVQKMVLTQLVNSLFGNQVTVQFSDKAPIVITKVVSVLAVGITRVCGFKAPTDIATTIGGLCRAADSTNEAICEFLVDVFGIDVDGKLAEAALLKTMEAQGEAFLALSTTEWTGGRLFEIRTWLTGANDQLRKPRGPKANSATRLGGIVAEVSRRLAEVSKAINTSKPRPTPYAAWFYGAPGIGKTEFVNKWLVPALAKKFNVSPAIYNLDSGKFSLPVMGQRWAVYDEAGTKTAPSTGEDIIHRLNQLISSGACQIPGAAVEDKNQVASFNAVFFVSNIDPRTLNFGLLPDAAAALITRLDIFHVRDDHFNERLGRVNQRHRLPDYGHLRFTTESAHVGIALGIRPDDVFRNTTVLDRAVSEIISHTNRFRLPPVDLHMDALPEVANGTFVLPSPMEDVVAQAGTPYVVSIFGPAGCRKTTEILPKVAGVMSLMGFECYTYLRDSNPTRTGQKLCWIVDDKFDFSDQQGCTDFLNFFVEKVRVDDSVIVVSNYGPNYSSLWSTVTRRDYHWVKVDLTKHPGVARRLGWDKCRPEAHAIYVAPDAAARDYWTDEGLAENMLIPRFMRHQDGVGFLKVETTIPSPLPFGKDEADAWWVSSEMIPETPTKLYLLRNISLSVRASKYFYKHCSGIMDSADWFEALKRTLLHTLTREVPGAKVYISLPQATFLVFNGVFYAGVGADEPRLVKSDTGRYIVSHPRFPALTNLPVHRKHFVHYMLSNLPSSTSLKDVTIFGAIARADLQKAGEFEGMTVHPAYMLTVEESSRAIKSARSKKKIGALQWLKDNWQLAASITGLTLAAAVIGTKIYKALKQNHLPDAPPVCDTCEFCAAGHYCPEKDWDCSQAKGKNKAKRRLRGFGQGGMRKFYWNGRVYYESDWEGDNFLEQLVHNANRRIMAGEYSATDTHYEMMVPVGDGKMVTGRMSRQGGDWYFSGELDVPQAGYSDEIEKVANNIGVGRCDGLYFSVTFLNSRLAVTSAHCVSEVEQRVSVTLPGPTVLELVVVSLDRVKELAFLSPVNPRGAIFGAPKIRDLTSMLVKRSLTPHYGHATTVTLRQKRAAGVAVFTGPFNIQQIPYPPIDGEAIRLWGMDVGFVAWGSAMQPTLPGDSGSPVLLSTQDGYRFLGVHAGVRERTCQTLFAVVSAESITDALSPRDRPQGASDTGLVDHMMPPQFCSLVNPAGKPALVVSSPAENLGTLKNRLPMDTRNDKTSINCPELEALFGNLKQPALQVAETEQIHADKIPPDKAGNLRAANIKLSCLQIDKEVDGVEANRLTTAAVTLAGYYKLRYGVRKVEPWSVLDAVNGTSADTQIPMDSSTGAAFQQLHPEAPTKGCLFQTNLDGRLEFNDTPAASTVQGMINSQWNMAAEMKYEALPASTSFKSELLPNEKAWKKRIINVVDPATVINQKRIMAPVMNVLTSDVANSDFQLKTNPYRDWDVLARRLINMNPDGITSLDFKNFDWTVPEEAFIALAHFIAEFFCREENPTLVKRIITLVSGIAIQNLLVGTDLIAKSHGMVSGIYGTSLCDSVIVKIMLYVAYSEVLGYKGATLAPVEQFFEHITSIGCGDDTTMAVAPTIIEQLPIEKLLDFLKEAYGMEATPPDKVGGVSAYVDLHQASFCSRKFVRFPQHPAHWTCQLKAEAMSAICCWSRFTSPADLKGQLEALRLEFPGWGEAKYNEFENALRSFCSQHFLEYEPRTWKTLTEEAWMALTTAPAPWRIKPNPCEILPVSDKKILHKVIDDFALRKNMEPLPAKELNYLTLGVKKRKECLHTAAHEAAHLAEFRQSRLADSFLPTVGPPKEKTGCIPPSMSAYHSYQLCHPEWFGMIVRGPSREQFHVLESLLLFTPMEDNGPAARRFNRDIEGARIALAACKNPQSKGAWQDVLGVVWPKVVHQSAVDPTGFVGKPSTTSEQSQRTGPDEGKPAAHATSSSINGGIPPGAAIPAAQALDGAPQAPSMVSTAGPAVPILAAIAGVDGALVPQRGWWRSFMSYGDPYFLRNYNILSGTQSGVVLDTFKFDPWDKGLIGPMCHKFAQHHRAFVGSIRLKMQVNAHAMLMGRVAAFWVPGTQVGRVNYTLASLWAMEKSEFDLNANSDFEIVMKASQESGFCVLREDLPKKSYGEVVIMTVTPLTNIYGQITPVTVTYYGCLGPDASYSDVIMEETTEGNNTIHLPLKGTLVADGIYQDLCTDRAPIQAQELVGTGVQSPVRPGMRQAMTMYKFATGASDPTHNVDGTPANVTIMFGHCLTGDVPSVPLRAVQQAADYTKIEGMDAALPATERTYTGRVSLDNDDAEFFAWAGPLSSTPQWIMGLRGPASANLLDATFTQWGVANATAVDGDNKFSGVNFGCHVSVTPHGSAGAAIDCNTNNVAQSYYYTHQRASVDINLTCQTGYTYTREPTIPANYVQVQILDEDCPNVTVLSTVAGPTCLLWDITTKYDDMMMFKKPGQTFASIVTDLVSGNGATLISLLRNQFGWWIRAPPASVKYLTCLDAAETFSQSHTPSTSVWPNIAEIDLSNWASRVPNAPAPASPPKVPSLIRHALAGRNWESQAHAAAAAMAGGAILGPIMSAIGKAGDQQNALDLQNRAQTFGAGMAQMTFRQAKDMAAIDTANQLMLMQNTYDYQMKLQNARLGSITSSRSVQMFDNSHRTLTDADKYAQAHPERAAHATQSYYDAAPSFVPQAQQGA